MIHNRLELGEKRAAYKAALDSQRKKVLICAGTGCVAGGALDIYDRMLALFAEKGVNAEVELAEEPHSGSVGVKKSGCHGFCEMGPLLRIEPEGWLYLKVKP